jgi:LacI family transcriptional regulator
MHPIAQVNSDSTIKDIAARCGVSSATISRVLNHPELVRPELRARVHAVLAEAGYVPHGAARSLVSRRTRTMGAVVPTVDSALFARVVDGLQQTIHDHGFQLLLASNNYSPAREAAEIRALIERGVDAMMLVGRSRSEEVYALLRARRIPFVTTCSLAPDAPWPTVGWDNHAAAARIADYLLDIGHSRFGIIAGVTADNDRAADRVAGYCAALARRGLALSEVCVIEKPYTVPDGRAAMAALLQLPQPPTAVPCGNDILAFGALQECLWRRVRVPQEISITGFDDIEMAEHCYPGITTLRVPAYEVGRCAATILLDAIKKQPAVDHARIDLQLIVRGTTAPPSGSPQARFSAKSGTRVSPST